MSQFNSQNKLEKESITTTACFRGISTALFFVLNNYGQTPVTFLTLKMRSCAVCTQNVFLRTAKMGLWLATADFK